MEEDSLVNARSEVDSDRGAASALHFVKYNNAVPITISVLLLSFSGALAASPEVRSDVAGAVLTSQQEIKTVDNTYIVGKDLSAYTPSVEITGVTEDADNYYVSYNLTTIDVKDYLWQDVTKPLTLEVSKAELGGQDLGLYVTRRLQDRVTWEIAYLKRVQDIEKGKGVSQRVVATTYSGLIGKFLDPKEETLPGYTPVLAAVAEGAAGAGGGSKHGAGASSGGNGAAAGQGSGGIIFQVLGKNPAQIPLRSTYSDLGVFLFDPHNPNIGYHTSGLDRIDTSTTTEYTITYSVKDQLGFSATATRKVIVYDPAKGPPIDPNTIPTVEPQLPPPTPPEVSPAPVLSAPAPASTAIPSGSTDAAQAAPADTPNASSTPASTEAPASVSAPANQPPAGTSSGAAASASSTPSQTNAAPDMTATSTQRQMSADALASPNNQTIDQTAPNASSTSVSTAPEATSTTP